MTNWQECKRISEVPEVDEALRLFAEGETTEDQAVAIVQAILQAAPPAQAAADARDAWIPAVERKPLESDGEVFVRFTDGTIGTAWATYWHGASNDFAQWTHPDPDEDRAVTHWMKAPPLRALATHQQGGK